jgi:hypothetical protein
MFPSSGEGRETPTLLSPLEIANLNFYMPTITFNLQKCEKKYIYFYEKRHILQYIRKVNVLSKCLIKHLYNINDQAVKFPFVIA